MLASANGLLRKVPSSCHTRRGSSAARSEVAVMIKELVFVAFVAAVISPVVSGTLALPDKKVVRRNVRRR